MKPRDLSPLPVYASADHVDHVVSRSMAPSGYAGATVPADFRLRPALPPTRKIANPTTPAFAVRRPRTVFLAVDPQRPRWGKRAPRASG